MNKTLRLFAELLEHPISFTVMDAGLGNEFVTGGLINNEDDFKSDDVGNDICWNLDDKCCFLVDYTFYIIGSVDKDAEQANEAELEFIRAHLNDIDKIADNVESGNFRVHDNPYYEEDDEDDKEE